MSNCHPIRLHMSLHSRHVNVTEEEYLENKGVKTETSEPQARAAVSTAAPSGVCSMAARDGRHSRRTPLREDGRTRLRTEWNGKEAGEL